MCDFSYRRRRIFYIEAFQMDLLDLLATHPNWKLSMGYNGSNEDNSDYGWCVHRVSGNHNDREWALIGFGETPKAALHQAASYKP